MQAPVAFQHSYGKYERYPKNLIHQPLYAGSPVAYEKKLRSEESRLLQPQNGQSNVKFRELHASGAMRKRTCFNDQELVNWLGAQNTSVSGALVTQEDPRCRFIFLWAQSSRTELLITRESLLRLLSYHQAMPEIVDFLSVFGRQEGPADPLFSNFCEQTMLAPRSDDLHMPGLGRSGRQFQLCYILKAPALVTPAERGNTAEWSIRPAAVHHQFDIELGTTLWMITRGGEDIYERVKHLTDDHGRPVDRDVSSPTASFRATLSIHLLVVFWALEQWKPYVQHLESMVKIRTGIAAYGDRSQTEHRHDYKPDELRLIQLLEDQVTLAISVLECNMQGATSLGNYYRDLLDNPDFCLGGSRPHILAFVHELKSFVNKMNVELVRAKFLVKIIADRKGLILQYLQHQENEKTTSLSSSMRHIALKSHREAIAMSIITVVTLVYLPGTFVSTKKAFFSTDVVKYQGMGEGSFSYPALMRWLQITLPLTLLTLVCAGIWFKRRDKQKKEDAELPLYVVEKNLAADEANAVVAAAAQSGHRLSHNASKALHTVSERFGRVRSALEVAFHSRQRNAAPSYQRTQSTSAVPLAPYLPRNSNAAVSNNVP